MAIFGNNPVASPAVLVAFSVGLGSRGNALCAMVSTVLLFVVSDNFKINFAVHKTSYKGVALARDPKMSISVWKLGEMLVQATGIVKEVVDSKEIDMTLDKLAAAVGSLDDFWPPVLQVRGKDYVVYELDLSWIRVLNLKIDTIRSDGDVFEQIK